MIVHSWAACMWYAQHFFLLIAWPQHKSSIDTILLSIRNTQMTFHSVTFFSTHMFFFSFCSMYETFLFSTLIIWHIGLVCWFFSRLILRCCRERKKNSFFFCSYFGLVVCQFCFLNEIWFSSKCKQSHKKIQKLINLWMEPMHCVRELFHILFLILFIYLLNVHMQEIKTFD